MVFYESELKNAAPYQMGLFLIGLIGLIGLICFKSDKK